MSAAEDTTGKRIFITGGASGLGRALAERYARAGYRVCIGDIHEERARETLGVLGESAHFVRCDVTREEDLAAAATWLAQNWGGVDIVVNNAGVSVAGGIDETPLDDWQWIIDVNLLGVVRGCKAFTPLFKKQKSGRLINVSSLSGLIHLPMMSAYRATKAAVVAISETLRVELEEEGIKVSVVCPAFFRTNLTETMRGGSDLKRLTTLLVEKSTVGADTIAEAVYQGVERDEFHILTHRHGRVAWMLKRLAPFPVYLAAIRRVTRRMMAKRDQTPVLHPEASKALS